MSARVRCSGWSALRRPPYGTADCSRQATYVIDADKGWPCCVQHLGKQLQIATKVYGRVSIYTVAAWAERDQ